MNIADSLHVLNWNFGKQFSLKTSTQNSLFEANIRAKISLQPTWPFSCLLASVIKLGSISSTFYTCIFHTKANWPAFLCLEFGFERTFVQKMRVKCWWNWPLYGSFCCLILKRIWISRAYCLSKDMRKFKGKGKKSKSEKWVWERKKMY